MAKVRRKTGVVKIGKVVIGGNNPVAIQSMTKTQTCDVEATARQINALEKTGCQIVRVAIRDSADARAIRQIKRHIHIPLVADIHFNWKLAIEAIESGADKIRLNPGNICKPQEVQAVVAALKSARIPLRVGVNSGSIEGAHTHKGTMIEKLVAGCLRYVRMIEKMRYRDMVISLKASTVLDTIEAYRLVARACQYPLHLGVTATGSPGAGAIKSAIACGILLEEGIGDTLRVSLTDDPAYEVEAAKAILEALELRSFGPQIISCPTCGRCQVDLVSLVKKMEHALSVLAPGRRSKPVKVAIMGCVVNGPGEAAEADIGIAFGKNEGLFFARGKPVRKVGFAQSGKVLLAETRKLYAATGKK